MPTLRAADLDRVDVVQTGLVIDRAIGVGGIPKRRPIEITGEPGMGKSTICLQTIAAAQAKGWKCAYADVEASFTPSYAANLGVNIKELDVMQEDNGEDMLNAILDAVDKETYDLIVIDSIGSLTTREQIEKLVGERSIGGQARIVGDFSRKLALKLLRKNVAIMAINHTQVDIMTGKTTSRGGASWNYHKAIRVHLSKKYGVVLKQGDKIIGYTVVFEVKEKNKMFGNVGSKYESQFINNVGFSASADLLQDAIDRGVFERKGNTFYLNGDKIGMISALREWIKIPENEARIKDALTT